MSAKRTKALQKIRDQRLDEEFDRILNDPEVIAAWEEDVKGRRLEEAFKNVEGYDVHVFPAEYIGKFPARQDITVLPADKPSKKMGLLMQFSSNQNLLDCYRYGLISMGMAMENCGFDIESFLDLEEPERQEKEPVSEKEWEEHALYYQYK
jgi:hypothetical protein